MVDLTTRLTKKSVLLFKKETTLGVDAVPTGGLNAVECSEPDYQIDVTLLERNYVADDLSPFANVIGRKQGTITFTTEIKGNGLQDSGNTADAPKFAQLLEVCGYAFSSMNSAATKIQRPVADFDNDPAGPTITWAYGGTVTLTKPVKYTIEVTVGGASATAEVSVTSNDLTVDDTTAFADQVVTSGSPIDIGGSGGELTLTWTGNLVLGDKWHVVVMPTGIKAKPISTGQPTATIYLYLDGVLHKMLAARGNVTITAEAGQIARAEFTYQGTFVNPTDAASPSTTYETTLPPQVELSNLTWGSQRDLVAAQWTFEQGNTITPRPDVNAEEGVKGYRITAREPTGGMNPEATLEADHPFWAEISAGKTQFFFAKVGQDVGNCVAVSMPKAQASNMPYGDRDGLRTYDVSFRCTRDQGDDEVIFYFV